MALDATIGGASSNSYVTRAEANTYFTDRFPSDLWDALSDADKDALLITSTLRLDIEDYHGIAANIPTQRLQFPRNVLYDRNYTPYATDEIPLNLQQATYEYAYFKLQRCDGFLDDVELHDAQYLKTYSSGPTTRHFKNTVIMDELPETVKRELRAIGWTGWAGERTVNRMTL